LGIFELVRSNLCLLPIVSAFCTITIRQCTDIVTVLVDVTFWRDVITDHPVSFWGTITTAVQDKYGLTPCVVLATSCR